ncbi:MAG: hypothetical protein JW778_06670 [Candidatus Altiarchaeota archaeon]|nr:hypothetical protein [Candidatus Altiarchaeota archaeon]
MELKDSRKEILVSGLAKGTEFTAAVVVFIFLGYFLGSLHSETGGVIGMLLGALVGFALGLYLLVKGAGQDDKPSI